MDDGSFKKHSANDREQARTRGEAFVCRPVSPETEPIPGAPPHAKHPFVHGTTKVGRIERPHDMIRSATKYARCAQLWPPNYLVRVSLFIEYRAPYFSRFSGRSSLEVVGLLFLEGRRGE